jgi:SAM-dependent methyltransferase
MDFQQRFAQIDAALSDGRLEEREWYEQTRELVETTYLASDDPQAQSGLGGDAEHWERRRRVITEALDREGTLLDVGCANGLLMETLAAWAEAGGYRIEPYGLEFSFKLAALARARLPAWADRIYAGNVMEWEPPRRFDYARTELVYVPRRHQPDLVSRLLKRVLVPGGRLIVCAYRERGTRDAADLEEILRSWEFVVGGEAVSVDMNDGGVATRVVWLDAPG